MIPALLIALVAVGLLYMGLKFYRQMDWQEKQEPSPDIRLMRKKQAQLRQFQELLSDAYEHGKISKKFLEEFHLYSEAEIQALQATEDAWFNRKSS